MPSPESQPNPEMDTPRETYGHRGKETLAARAQRLQEALDNEERLSAEREDLIRRIDELRQRLSSRSQEPEPESTPPNPGAPEAPTPAPASPEAPADDSPEAPADDSPEAPAPASPEAPADGSPTPEELNSRERMRKIKKNRTIKGVLIAAVALAASITIALGVSKGLFGSSGTESPQNSTEPEQDRAVSDTMAAPELDDDLEIKEAIGIRDGYNEYGMWSSKNKSYGVNFAAASEVAEACNLDEVEMVKYTAGNQVESFADYLANLPEELQPEAVRGKSIIETERYLESITDEEYENVRQQFNDIMDGAFTRRVDLKGTFNNAYMRLKDPDGPVTHENMELVRCTTNEKNKFTEFYWTDKDGNNIGSMVVKITPVYDKDGNIVGYNGCIQVITPTGEKPQIYDNLPEIPDPDPSGTEWGKSGDPHGGNLVEQSDQVNPDSEVSEEQNNSTNSGNQGYVPYASNATPGSASESSSTSSYTEFASSGILATDATTDGGRIIGGEDQATDSDGSSAMAGENAYQNSGASAGEETGDADEAGNAAQAEAQESGGSNGEGSTPGGDNYSDSDEESIVAGGDF